jgi:ribosome maturation factor RimP
MAEAKLVLTDALIAESLRRGKAAERMRAAENDNQPADANGRDPQDNPFHRASGQDRSRAQHEEGE